MAIEFYEEFVRSKDDKITNGKYYSLSTACMRPKNTGYQMISFGDDPAVNLANDQKPLWEAAGGVDSFLEFESDGYVTHPESFAAKAVSLVVNPLGSLDRFKFAEKGSLGDGWYNGRTFLLRIYMDLLNAQQLLALLQSPTSINEAEVGLLENFQRDVTGFDAAHTNIRFHLFNVVWQARPQWTSYEICRIYV